MDAYDVIIIGSGAGGGTLARHLGNVPQAFSHLALIEAAARIILAERVEEMSL